MSEGKCWSRVHGFTFSMRMKINVSWADKVKLLGQVLNLMRVWMPNVLEVRFLMLSKEHSINILLQNSKLHIQKMTKKIVNLINVVPVLLFLWKKWKDNSSQDERRASTIIYYITLVAWNETFTHFSQSMKIWCLCAVCASANCKA